MPHMSLFPTPIGVCGIAWSDDVVVATSLPDKTEGMTAKRFGGASEAEPPDAIRRAVNAITGLLSGDRTDLNFIACDFSRLDPFAVSVYVETRAIAAGETLTYGEVAERLGDRRLAQRVGQALGRNRFPIIVPCHRVLGANGRLTGFSAPGGVGTKLRMLAIEGAQIAEPPGLFGDLPFAVKPEA